MAMLLVRIRHRVMFSGIEQLALLVAHVALCLADPRRHDAGRGAREVGGDLELMREVDRVASQLGGDT